MHPPIRAKLFPWVLATTLLLSWLKSEHFKMWLGDFEKKSLTGAKKVEVGNSSTFMSFTSQVRGPISKNACHVENSSKKVPRGPIDLFFFPKGRYGRWLSPQPNFVNLTQAVWPKSQI